MQSLFRSYEHFRSATTDIAKHLRNTKLAVLREAVAKAHGFKNVSSYEASFAPEATSTIPVDPNIRCELRDGLVVYQGRIDGLVNLGNDPEMLEAAERINMSVQQWKDLHRSADMRGRIAWENALEKAWGIRHSKVGLLEIDGVVYARAVSSLEMFGDVDSVAEDFANFLSHQPAYSAELWAVWAVVDYMLVNVIYTEEELIASRIAQRYNEDTWDLGLTVSDYFPYDPFPGLDVSMKSVAGMLGWSKVYSADFETWYSVIGESAPRSYRDYAQSQMLWFDDKQSGRAWEMDWAQADEQLDVQTTGLMVLMAEESLLVQAMMGLGSDEMTPARLKAVADQPLMPFQAMADLMLMRHFRV